MCKCQYNDIMTAFPHGDLPSGNFVENFQACNACATHVRNIHGRYFMMTSWWVIYIARAGQAVYLLSI